MEYIRLFIAIELPQDVKDVLVLIQAGFKKADYPVKWVEPAGIHLTLKFLGEVPSDKIDPIKAAIEIAAQTVAPLSLALNGTGVFPNPRRTQIVWVGLSGDVDRLLLLQKNIESEVSPLGFPTEARPSSPHLTLGRVRDYASPVQRPSLGELVTGTQFKVTPAFKVKSVSLMRSQLSRQGAVYSQIAAAPLKISAS
jgi:RNA 2',3'-cyclic 3'-phosphodiesterase